MFGFDRHNAPQGTFRWVNGVLHYISGGAGDRLLRLADRYELIWATGWEQTANEYLPYFLGLSGELPCLSFDCGAVWGTAHWKIAAIEAHAGRERPLAWIDDSLDESCRAWAEDRPGPTLLVHTLSAEGILDRHVEDLLAWADALRV